MKTSAMPSAQTSQEDKYPSYEEIINTLPAKHLVALANSRAILEKSKYGYYIHIFVHNQEAWESLKGTEKFEKSFDSVLLPWALRHPSIYPEWFRGFLFSVTSEEGAARYQRTKSVLNSLGAELLHVIDS